MEKLRLNYNSDTQTGNIEYGIGCVYYDPSGDEGSGKWVSSMS